MDSADLLILMVGAHRSGKTTIAGLMAKYPGLPSGLKIVSDTTSDAPKRPVDRLEWACRRAEPWSAVDVHRAIPPTPRDSVRRYTYTLWWVGGGEQTDLLTVRIVDVAGAAFLQKLENLQKRLTTYEASIDKIDACIFCLDAITLVEYPPEQKRQALGIDHIAPLVADLMNSDKEVFCVVTRCESYLLEGEHQRRRLVRALGWWEEEVGLKGAQSVSVRHWARPIRVPVLTTGCLRLLELRGQEPIFEKTDREFSPRLVGALYGQLLRTAISKARERRGRWQKLLDFFSGRSERRDKAATRLEAAVSAQMRMALQYLEVPHHIYDATKAHRGGD